MKDEDIIRDLAVRCGVNPGEKPAVVRVLSRLELAEARVAELEAKEGRHRWGLQWMLNNLTGIDHEWAKEVCAIARQSLNP